MAQTDQEYSINKNGSDTHTIDSNMESQKLRVAQFSNTWVYFRTKSHPNDTNTNSRRHDPLPRSFVLDYFDVPSVPFDVRGGAILLLRRSAMFQPNSVTAQTPRLWILDYFLGQRPYFLSLPCPQGSFRPSEKDPRILAWIQITILDPNRPNQKCWTGSNRSQGSHGYLELGLSYHLLILEKY